MNKKKIKKKFGSASIPMGILEEIDDLIKNLRYWPSRGAFVREACLEKIRQEKHRLEELSSARGTKQGSASERAGDVTNRRSDDSSQKREKR